MVVKEIASKEALVKSKLPAADYVVNAYTGCTHKCIYCYAEFWNIDKIKKCVKRHRII